MTKKKSKKVADETQLTALIIIDVQASYLPKRRDGLRNIESLVNSATKINAPIIILEFANGNAQDTTITRITEHLIGYSNYVIKKKLQMSGAKQILRACEDLDITPKKLVFCGYDFAACVYWTIHDLQDREEQLILVQNATNYSSEFASQYTKIKNLKLVSIGERNTFHRLSKNT